MALLIPQVEGAPIPVDSMFTLSRAERTLDSKFDKTSQTVSSPTGFWEFELRFKNIRRAQANELFARLWGLRGSTGRFELFDWSQQYADGVGGSYTILASPDNLPGSVRITGLPVNSTIALGGNYVSINGELKGLLESVNSDHLGRATVVFEPWLRKPVVGGETVNFDQPTGIFKLVPGFKVPRKSSKKLVLADLKIKGVEAIDL